MGGMAKPRRIRDPIHDLIEFSTDDLDQLAWSLLNSPEFQRLRRIKQLGFSELVFPGATHSRLAHSVGVFHTARNLSRLICDRLDKFDPDRAIVAQAAALVHDLGHGPFSHSFEGALKKLGIRKRHEEWTVEMITGDTKVATILKDFSSGFGDEVAKILASETPVDIYSSIVSSQFDADRLDYVRRDRLMTGAQHGGFDFSWLMANLEVDKVAISTDGEQFAEVQMLILGNKAFESAEEYVLGLFHLYFTVYFHKTTRSAEKMLAALVARIGQLVKDDNVGMTGLTPRSALIRFLREPSLSTYLALDDFIVWATLHECVGASDPAVAELSSRILNRQLYKAIDVSASLKNRGGEASVARFRAELGELQKSLDSVDVLEDQVSRNPYERRGYESPDALKKVLIRRVDGTAYEDLRDRSDVVKALQPQSTFRVYVRDEEAKKKVETILGRIAQ
jgi:HD superfamily phosphohydrolase